MAYEDKTTEHWTACVRYRDPEDAGINIDALKGGVHAFPEGIFYNWKLEFAHGDTQQSVKLELIKKIKELREAGKIICDSDSAVNISQIIEVNTYMPLSKLEELGS